MQIYFWHDRGVLLRINRWDGKNENEEPGEWETLLWIEGAFIDFIDYPNLHYAIWNKRRNIMRHEPNDEIRYWIIFPDTPIILLLFFFRYIVLFSRSHYPANHFQRVENLNRLNASDIARGK